MLSSVDVNALHVTFNKTLNDRPLPEFFIADGSRQQRLQPAAGLHGRQRHRNGFTVGTGGTNPGYFNSDSFQIADDVDIVRGNHQFSFGGNWIHTKIETLNNRPTNGAVHVQRPDDGPRRSPTSCSGA